MVAISSSASLAKSISISSGLSTPERSLPSKSALSDASFAASLRLPETSRSVISSNIWIIARSSADSSSEEYEEKGVSSMRGGHSYLLYQIGQQRRYLQYRYICVHT